ncbi:MAG: DUF4159 domain-containing protein [Spirulinaceae cyanobacterium]
MKNNHLPPPTIKPFERISIRDGLLINAERWRLAHDYHRQRQNVHFQSLNQPGIVCDLGVHIIPPPMEVSAKYRDKRWVQIQPGIAIDLFGNFIVITDQMDFRISSENRSDLPMTVYLAISYVDPEKLHRKPQNELVKETFRIVEKATPPSETEVELCRVVLPPGGKERNNLPVELRNAQDVFYPQKNELDLRFRQQARSRPQSIISTGVIADASPQQEKNITNLSYLLQSLPGLYPFLQGEDVIAEINLAEVKEQEESLDQDLIYLNYQPEAEFEQAEVKLLEDYLTKGGLLLVEVATQGNSLGALLQIQQELQQAIADVAEDPELAGYVPDLEAELFAVKEDLAARISSSSGVFQDLATKLNTPLRLFDDLPRDHPLRTKPFLFAALPKIKRQGLQILTGGGIVAIIGNLSLAWGLDPELALPRETIRTAQEMGINILLYAWYRKQMIQLQKAQANPTPTPPPQQPQSPKKEKAKKSKRSDQLFEQLM